MTAASLQRIERAAALAAHADDEAQANTQAAILELDALAAGIKAADDPSRLLDLLFTARERLNDAWRASASQLNRWREVVEAQRPPCCAAARPCLRELLARAALVLRQIKGADLCIAEKPRAFVFQGRRLVASLARCGHGQRLEVRDEAGGLVAASLSERYELPDHNAVGLVSLAPMEVAPASEVTP